MNRPIRVVQVLPTLEGGGVERGVLEVGQALVDNGFSSIVISGGGRLVAQLEQTGSQHIQFPVGEKSLASLFRVRRFRAKLIELAPDIIHVRSRLPAWLTYFALRGWPKTMKRPVWLNTVHGLYSVSRYSAIMTRSDHVIAVSEAARRYILENYLCPSERITVIPRGIDPGAFPYGYVPDSTFVQQFKREHHIEHHRPILTLPGRFTRLKGHSTFIRLIAALKQRWPNVLGLMVGKIDPKRSEYVDALRAQIAAAQLQDNLRIVDQVAQIRDVYAMSDIVLSLSEKPESFGRTVLEALSLGVPVVGWAYGGVAEILEHVFPQGAVEKNNMRSLVNTVNDVMESAPKPSQQHPFTLQNSLEKELALYRDLMRRTA